MLPSARRHSAPHTTCAGHALRPDPLEPPAEYRFIAPGSNGSRRRPRNSSHGQRRAADRSPDRSHDQIHARPATVATKERFGRTEEITGSMVVYLIRNNPLSTRPPWCSTSVNRPSHAAETCCSPRIEPPWCLPVCSLRLSRPARGTAAIADLRYVGVEGLDLACAKRLPVCDPNEHDVQVNKRAILGPGRRRARRSAFTYWWMSGEEGGRLRACARAATAGANWAA